MLDPKTWNEELLKQYSADMRQFVGARECTLNGQRALHLYNAVGLEFIVLPDRGFDIWDARYKGIPLTWLAPGSPHPPDWGAGWLRGFNGGLLTTCGLTHVGPAEIDDLTGERSDIHGNYTRLRAENYQVDGTWEYTQPKDDVNYFEIRYSAKVQDKSFFGTQLTLTRTYFLNLQHPDIGIIDVITNDGDTPAPFMLLYHFNLGFPLIHEGTRLYSSGKVYPRDSTARAGIKSWQLYDAPLAAYPEQVFYHHLRSKGDRTDVLVGDDALAIQLSWETKSLPYFTQWKNTRLHQYVNGIEPGNCIPEGRNAARRAGRLKMLQPGEVVDTYLKIDILDSPERIGHSRQGIASLDEDGKSIPTCFLSDYKAGKKSQKE